MLFRFNYLDTKPHRPHALACGEHILVEATRARALSIGIWTFVCLCLCQELHCTFARTDQRGAFGEAGRANVPFASMVEDVLVSGSGCSCSRPVIVI